MTESVHTHSLDAVPLLTNATLYSSAGSNVARRGPNHTWYFMCGPFALNLFILGIAFNIHIFRRHKIPIERIFGIQQNRIPTATSLVKSSATLFSIQFALYMFEVYHQKVHAVYRMERVLVLYCITVFLLLCWPWDVWQRKYRRFILRNLYDCVWPFSLAKTESATYYLPSFSQVFIADALTSISKFLQDACGALLLCYYPIIISAENQNQNQLEWSRAYEEKLKQFILPYFVATIPYIIRAVQCLTAFQRTLSVNDRFLHLLNALKYGSSILVITVGAYPQITRMGYAELNKNPFFMCCAVFNSFYSFLWDVMMDWGLGHPKAPSSQRFLRHHLLYRPYWLYYVIILIDFILRILWVTKWWDWRSYGFNFKLLVQIAEVVRRCVWNCVRIEYENIKLESTESGNIDDTLKVQHMVDRILLRRHDSSDSKKSSTSTVHSDARRYSKRSMSSPKVNAVRSVGSEMLECNSSTQSPEAFF
uniref:Inositol monophosphatase putative n=1 Tax=Albugo laibachii Nc14 TaxID=890382 RepID=F0W7E1_9STRA|nr:inositol monophosphatase putative [Albugo laibachii Nc14]|eukprot:CCA17040.1 inositol monophosphatase putative [Albugo laibachii Nc14]